MNFTPWYGNRDCPVNPLMRVEAELADGTMYVGVAGRLDWQMERVDGPTAVVAYRLDEPKTERINEQKIELIVEPCPLPQMDVPGYESLSGVLRRAYQQAAAGKGRERHAQGEPFHEQIMQVGADKFGVGSLLFQAFKKSEESQRLPLDRGVAELLGAINYLAGAVIARERKGE